MASQDPDTSSQRAPAQRDAGACFHCGEPLPAGTPATVAIAGADQPMCCAGCQAVAQTIVDAGLADYYRLRTQRPARAEERVPRILEQAALYRRPALAGAYSREAGEHAREVSLMVEGIDCAACAWLVERTLGAQPGVLEASMNFSTHRARVRFDSRGTDLGQVLESVARIGYGAQPYDPDRHEAALEAERRTRLRRLGVAGLFGMQIMMVAVVLYAGDWWGMDPAFEGMFRWLSLLLSLPVVGYCAWPFFTAAARGIGNRTPGMDLPVALGITIAFAASVHATVSASGHVYFDSVAMFTFFLLLARYLEFLARKRAQERTEALVSPVPELARRLDDDDMTLVPVIELAPGDRVRVLPGESIPADGVVTAGAGFVDESLLSGESRPVDRHVGDPVLAGAVNGASPLELQVRRVGEDMVISRVLALVESAAATRPRLALLADRVAGIFVLFVIAVAACVAAWWWQADAELWLPATVAVLVITCPCALSLATPTALTSAAATLTAAGLVPARGLAVETLAQVDHVVFDKTGTLTTGRYRLLDWTPLDGNPAPAMLRTAAALERHSEHPIARAVEAHTSGPLPTARDVCVEAGRGISALVAGKRWWLGEPGWVTAASGCAALNTDQLAGNGATVVVLAGENGSRCRFVLGDDLRDGARELVAALQAHGYGVSLYSGDRGEAVERIADALGIQDRAGGLLPQDKLDRLQALARRGLTTAMVGDGVNDAPVLAGAAVSVAMGGGAQAARASADFILINERLPALLECFHVARRTHRIVVQNMLWAVTYNLLALPLAAAGLIAPWMAAIGMSLSSLLVVGNSLRLGRSGAGRGSTVGHDGEGN